MKVFLEGEPIIGVVDSGSDITIMGKELLKCVAAAAKLTKNRLKKVDRLPKTYDGRPFTLHGRMDLDITFQDTTMHTPVYIKLDTSEPLLLSEGVCRQLYILSYHPSVVRETGKSHPRVGAHGDNSGKERQCPIVTEGDKVTSTDRLHRRDPGCVPQLSENNTKDVTQTTISPAEPTEVCNQSPATSPRNNSQTYAENAGRFYQETKITTGAQGAVSHSTTDSPGAVSDSTAD